MMDTPSSVVRVKLCCEALSSFMGNNSAPDGDIGHVKDCYFDDQQWVVRYVIADTGSWLSGRLVLLSPHAFGKIREDGNCLLVSLTRQQIENAPAIESHEPVSRQYEEEHQLLWLAVLLGRPRDVGFGWFSCSAAAAFHADRRAKPREPPRGW